MQYHLPFVYLWRAGAMSPEEISCVGCRVSLRQERQGQCSHVIFWRLARGSRSYLSLLTGYIQTCGGYRTVISCFAILVCVY
jgi:hypothetical protein